MFCALVVVLVVFLMALKKDKVSGGEIETRLLRRSKSVSRGSLSKLVARVPESRVFFMSSTLSCSEK